MNFVDAQNDERINGKPADRKSNDAGQDINESSLDKAADDMATKASARQLQNEQTNSSNTTFSK